jgi:hypothetical protein
MKKFKFILVICTLAIFMAGNGMTAAWPPAGFTESVADQNTAFPFSKATAVTVSAPLPASCPSHPAACDKLNFLRVRHVNGPVNPSDADRILIAQPGILEGASAFYNVAANLVTRAYNEKGKFVEFWAIDRRSNCLEDMNGLRLARETGNLHDLVDYYYRNKPYKGQYFQGYIKPLSDDAKWLVEMGMEQTLNDWNQIITRGIPDQSVRQQKVYIGGHSLGGFLTGAYACADFDGNPTTLADAGYNQAAGYFALDSLITSDPLLSVQAGDLVSLRNLLGKIPDGAVSLMRAGLFERFIFLPGVITPEIMHLLTGVGYAAMVAPNTETDLISYLPAPDSVKGCYRFYHSRNIWDYLAGKPSIYKFRYTNQALMALFMDDNAMPINIIQASLGFFGGGSVAEKQFPFGSGGTLAIANDSGTALKKGPLYRWINYNEIEGTTIPNNNDGVPFTTAAKEVTDANDLARSLGALPMDFVEKYFPMRLAVESMMGSDVVVHPEGISMNPLIDIVAGDGAKLGEDQLPPDSPIIPGYNHLDVLTAAAVQNDGQPEKVVTNLLNFIFP